MKNLTKFNISNTQYLKINPECIHKDECETCANIDIDYIDESKNICIRFGYEPLSDFSYILAKSEYMQQLLTGIKILDTSITQDLGIDWNQYFKGLRGPTKADEYYFWGNSHKQIRPYFSSWMYNDANGNVIFEITPFYPFFYETKKSHPDFITYKEFMKNYKPTLKTIIPKKNLKQWIKQAQELDKIYFPQFYEK